MSSYRICIYLFVVFAVYLLQDSHSSMSSDVCYGFSDSISDSCSCNKEFLNHINGMGRIGNTEKCNPCYYGVGFSISFKCELCPANSSSIQGDRFCICNPGFAQSSSNRVPVCTWLKDETEFINSTLSVSSLLTNQSDLAFRTSVISENGAHVYGIPVTMPGKLFYSHDFGINFQIKDLISINGQYSNILTTLAASGDGKYVFIGGMPGPLTAICFDTENSLCSYGEYFVMTSSYYYSSITVNYDSSIVLAVEMAKDPNTNELYIKNIRQATHRNFGILHSLSVTWIRPQHFILTSLLSYMTPRNLIKLATSVAFPNITRVASDYLYNSLSIKTSRNGDMVVYALGNSLTTYLSYNWNTIPTHAVLAPCSSTYLDMSHSGRYVYCISPDHELYRSEDHGVSFQVTHEKFREVAVDHSGQVVLGLDMFYNLFESYDYGKTFSILTGGVTSFALAKASYGLDNKDLSKNPDYLYITSTKQGVRYNRLKPTIYEPCGIGYHSSTGYGPLCVSCPLSSTNTFIGQTECTICRNGYFGINGEAPCHEYYEWLPYATISIYTTAIIIASFFYSNKDYLKNKYKEMKKHMMESKGDEDDERKNTENKEKGKDDEESKLGDSQVVEESGDEYDNDEP